MMSKGQSSFGRAGVTLRELEVLRALVAVGKTTAAADRLGISQPAVSRTLSQLERRLGRQLFRRDGGRLFPTAEAISIDHQLEPVFAAIGRIGEGTEADTAGELVLRVAAPPTIAHRFLTRHIAAFATAHPRARVSMDVFSSDVLVTTVAESRVDLAITDSEPKHLGVHVEPFFEAEAVCLIPRSHPLAARDTITAKDIDGEPFIALTRRHSARAAIDRALAASGVECRSVIETSTAVTAADFVAEGLGLTLLNPFPVTSRLSPEVVVRPFRPVIRCCVSFLLPSGARPTPGALAFMAQLRADTSVTVPARPCQAESRV